MPNHTATDELAHGWNALMRERYPHLYPAPSQWERFCRALQDGYYNWLGVK